VADIVAIQDALASQISSHTGLAATGRAPDQITPPMAIIVPGSPLIHYGETFEGSVTLNLRIVIALSDAPPSPEVQATLNAYLGIGPGVNQSQSIAAAIQADPTLGGVTPSGTVPLSAGNYGRIEWAGQIYFGARIDVQVLAI
jgi:hypothetical protein